MVLDRENDVPSLQQMAELTNGIYSRVREPPMLLQTLLTYHLADDTTRHLLAAIPQKLVDGRAICFTTREIVDIGTSARQRITFAAHAILFISRPPTYWFRVRVFGLSFGV